jgi:hypothetical protein
MFIFLKKRLKAILVECLVGTRESLFGWLVLVCSERRVLLAGCWWLVRSERKVLLASG